MCGNLVWEVDILPPLCLATKDHKAKNKILSCSLNEVPNVRGVYFELLFIVMRRVDGFCCLDVLAGYNSSAAEVY